MRVLWSSFAGLVIGAIAGLAWFFTILFTPSSLPDNMDGGAGPSVIVAVIALGFSIVGGMVGGLLGLLVGLVHGHAMAIFPARTNIATCDPNSGKLRRLPDEDLV
jgi:hypothetical protein